MSSWIEKLNELECGDLIVASGESADAPHPFASKEWAPNAADKSAAWQLYTEIRSRITTQPLAFRDGDEETALTSIYNIFGLTREAIKEHEGCAHFATLSISVLNVHIRPFTAYWHKVKLAGRLSSSDTCHRFRRELITLQARLRVFMKLLGYLAEGDEFQAGTESGIETASIYPEYDLGDSLKFGVAGSQIPIRNATAIDAVERSEVLARRKYYGLAETPEDAVGLAVSGGGIRSATFALGVVQYLARKGIIKSVDFVSTVSGGGYLGSFMSSYLNDPGNPHATLDPGPDSQPFGELGSVESKAVRHLRNHSKYMAEGGFQTYALAMAQMMWGIAVNLFLILPFILAAVLVAKYVSSEAFVDAAKGSVGYPSTLGDLTILVAAVLLVAAMILPIVQNLGRNAGTEKPRLKVFSSRYESCCIGLLVILFGLLLWNFLPLGYRMYYSLAHGGSAVGSPPKGLSDTARKALLAAAASAGPFLSGMLLFVSTRAHVIKKISITLLILSGPVFFLVAFCFLIDMFVVNPEVDSSAAGPFIVGLRHTTILWSLFIVVTLYSFCLNINFTSPHRYYRRQLSRTYLRRSINGADDTEPVDSQTLSGLTQPDSNGHTKAPYHFVNCALNIPACDDPNLRGRESDFFIFSKHFCGSPIAGYSATREWEAIDGHVDLATAMSISAATAAPRMGSMTDAKMSYLLAVLNVRLNYWVSPPRKPSKPDTLREPRWWLRMRTPGAWEFLKEMTGAMMNENSNFLNLSDGGHVENLAIYELLRRRCKFIIAIDGEADPDRTFHGLLKLVRLANIDLGVTIDPDLGELRKIETGDSKSHFMLCKIDYGQDQPPGFLLYIKLSMTGNESEFLQKYRAEHPAFPHQPTSDQLFDESQFEVYRALGEHVGADLFRSELVDPIQPGKPNLPEQPTVRQWFQGLAKSLLE